MQPPKPRKIVYLFGAGATHAELQNLYPRLIEVGRGLLISDVSSRVIERARRHKKYVGGLEMVSGTSGSLNIELLISLIENSKIHGWETKTRLLKALVRSDIQGILPEWRVRTFYLHKALFELHSHPAAEAREQLTGVISLNYEDVLDRAFRRCYGDPDYCFSPSHAPAAKRKIPLLKLHGSFSWRNQSIRGRRRTIDIIPLGSSKSYLHAPYRFIWNQALETLVECDTLRVVGCSLSQNDFHLVDLLFEAHVEKGADLELEIIGPEKDGVRIQGEYGFFPKIRRLLEIEKHLVPEPHPENPFKEWLKYKGVEMLGGEAKRTLHLKKLVG